MELRNLVFRQLGQSLLSISISHDHSPFALILEKLTGDGFVLIERSTGAEIDYETLPGAKAGALKLARRLYRSWPRVLPISAFKESCGVS